MSPVVVAINDISFRHSFPNRALASDALHRLIEVYLEIKKPRYTKVDLIYGETLDTQTELVAGLKLIQLLKGFETTDEKRLLLTILTRLRKPNYEGAAFCTLGQYSRVCASATDGVVISLNSRVEFSGLAISGTLDGQPCVIRNIAEGAHIGQYDGLLGRRLYIRSPKHRLEEYKRSGEDVSVMDLADEEAQALLDRAIAIGEGSNRLYGKLDGLYYVFPITSGNTYHGFRHDSLPQHIQRKIDIAFS